LIESLKRKVKRIVRGRVDFGDLGGTRPISPQFGFERGTPIDRYYIDAFLERNRSAIFGSILEVGDDSYTKRFGGERVARADILHIDAASPRATITGDLSDRSTLPEAEFDCAIITQTIHLIYDMRASVQNLYRSLKPGGTLLLTSPGITPVARDRWQDTWFWSMTPAGARKLFGEVFGDEHVEVDFYGNVFASIALLTGVATEEVSKRKLDVKDESYPVIVAVRGTRRSAGG